MLAFVVVCEQLALAQARAQQPGKDAMCEGAGLAPTWHEQLPLCAHAHVDCRRMYTQPRTLKHNSYQGKRSALIPSLISFGHTTLWDCEGLPSGLSTHICVFDRSTFAIGSHPSQPGIQGRQPGAALGVGLCRDHPSIPLLGQTCPRGVPRWRCDAMQCGI